MSPNPDLSAFDLFSDSDQTSLSRLASGLTTQRHEAGAVLMRQGEPGASFVIVLDGVVTASHVDSAGSRTVGRAGPGSILGELSMLTSGARHATVTADTPVRTAVGGDDAFEELLGLPGVRERLTDIAARRLASVAEPMRVTLRDGSSLLMRPLLPDDRDRLASAFDRQSTESIRRRFFTTTRPSARIIDYLVNIDYIDHFAWGASTEDGRQGVAEARYVRLRNDPAAAEVAFNVVDDYQGRGLATLLLGALAVIATSAGVARFVASVLYENAPMRAVLAKAGAVWQHQEPGIVSGSVDVSVAEGLVEEPLRSELARTARRVVTAAGLALHASPQ